MNFIKGKISENGILKFQSIDNSINLNLGTDYSEKLESYRNKNIWLGIRPEDIYDSSITKNESYYSPVTVNLEVVEPMGNEILLYFNFDNEQFVARIPAREIPEAGKMKELLFDTNKLHFFDFETEKTIY
jgi:multiple sugar transport system ATP-binding protein